MTFGQLLWATLVLVAFVAIAEQYDQRIAYLLATATLTGLALKNPGAIRDLADALAGR